MKIGDKCLCKKSLQIKLGVSEDNIIYDIFDISNFYKITKIGKKRIFILGLYHEPFSTIRCDISPWYFYDYFYSSQEIRKIKLEKIHDNSM